ncbi:MAG: serine/threonine protein kinase [Planctomycetes bacterium]|nr:serine/threonine protein kinase [Planctomycetota bacterium]
MNGASQVTSAWLAINFPDLQGIQPLSRGGQKEVFSAKHNGNGEVVLKLMHPNSDVERTKRELLAVAKVRSPRVPVIFDQGSITTPVGDCFWFREQRVAGQSVRARLAGGAMSTAEVLRLGLHISEALLAAESVGIVHRDVKPDNIILDPHGAFWLIDFGLARHLGLESLTATANAFGHVTWGYAPLEQCRNLKQEIDSRADLFALGVTLYECATGANPFRVGAGNVLDILKRVEQGQLARLNLSFPSSSTFADLVSALTQKQRVHRPQSVKDAYDWIKDICAAEGVQ